MEPYLGLLREVYESGIARPDRTGTGTRSVFGRQVRYDLRRGFPAVTTKRLWMKGVVHELLWFLRGSTDARELQREGVHIWDAWAGEGGELGPVYGAQWRSWGARDGGAGVDQIAALVRAIRTNPSSRRHIVSAWNVSALPSMALPPCHVLFQAYVAQGELSLQVYQRSADVFLGVPFNVASYALLTHMLAQVCDLKVGELVHTLGDAHLYENHLEQAELQLSRAPFDSPRLRLNPARRSLDAFTYGDVELVGYEHHPAIKAPIAV